MSSDAPPPAAADADPNAPVSIFVGNFGKDNATVPALEELFEDNGITPTKVDVKRGFAFVYAQPNPNIPDIVAKMNGTATLPNGGANALRVEVSMGGKNGANKKPSRDNVPPSTTLFVINFDIANTTRQNLTDLFEPFGALRRVDIQKNYAFVEFAELENAITARENTNGGKLNLNTLCVEFSEAKPRRSDGNRNYNGGRDGPGSRGPGRDGGGWGGQGGWNQGPPQGYNQGPPHGHDDRGRGPPQGWGGDRGGYDDRRGPPQGEPRYDDRGAPPPRYDDRGGGGGWGGPPQGGGYDDRRGGGGGGYDDRGPPRDYDNRGPPRDERGRGPPRDDRNGGYRERSRSRERGPEGGGHPDRYRG